MLNDHVLMGYCRFEDILPLRKCAKKRNLPQKPKTVIVCVFPYKTGEYPERNVARYAVVNDYHVIADKRLASLASQLKAVFPDEEFVWFADDSPVREVNAAAKCGLGVIGGHGMLITGSFGSWVNIGEIVTTLELQPKQNTGEIKSCLNCGRCVEACPTGAFTLNSPFDRSLCRSAITQLKTLKDEFQREEIKKGGMLCGCDICTDACPMNENVELTPIREYYDDALPVVTRENLSANIAKKPYNWRGEDVILRNLSILRTQEDA